ncbi:MAG: flavin reductase [Pseudomonadota bacterium]
MSQIDPRAFRDALGSFMTGVTVVTTHDADGAPLGFTANSFTSVSLDPPLVSVCLAKTSQNYSAVTCAPGFAVNILSEAQVEISNRFARPVADRFAATAYVKGPAGAPILEDVTAWFDCATHKLVEAGDHVILIGEVKAFDSSARPGLGYARGAYFMPDATAEALSKGTELIVSAVIERGGQVLLRDDGNGGLALPEISVTETGVHAALTTLIQNSGLTATPGFVYSIFEDTHRRRQHIAFLCDARAGTPTHGSFVPLSAEALDDVSDPAILTMLERRATERRDGTFGIYVGTQSSGDTRVTT